MTQSGGPAGTTEAAGQDARPWEEAIEIPGPFTLVGELPKLSTTDVGAFEGSGLSLRGSSAGHRAPKWRDYCFK